MLANQKNYECGLDDIKMAFDILLDDNKHRAVKRKVGELLQEIDVRNEKEKITDVKGINISKQFMPSVADTTNVNLNGYKMVEKGQFAYSGMQTGRDECIRIALHTGNDPIIISPAYTVLQIKDDSVLPEYIMMWFSRQESDRQGWFMSDASIRANLDLERFLETEIPVPDLIVQKSIVEIYRVFISRREINERLKTQIKNLCPILIKGAMEEAST